MAPHIPGVPLGMGKGNTIYRSEIRISAKQRHNRSRNRTLFHFPCFRIITEMIVEPITDKVPEMAGATLKATCCGWVQLRKEESTEVATIVMTKQDR